MSDVSRSTGIRLRKLRMERDLTLEQLSELTGVSVSMLSAIERGMKSPTINILHKINTGLNIPLSELFEESLEREPRVVHRRDAKFIKVKRGCELTLLLDFDERNRFEVMRQEIAPHTRWDSEPRFGGDIWAHCFPMNGALVVQLDEERHVVKPGETLSFISDVRHAYINDGDETLVVILINAYR